MATTTEKVKTRDCGKGRKLALSTAPKLARTTFHTSRQMDFFSAKELVTQTGHEMDDWPLVVVKELVDNALDACEDANVGPVIDIIADATGIRVRDNGPGLPEATLEGALDFSVRASNREAYVAPDRGAQGNALKTLLPMPGIIDPTGGQFVVTAHNKKHIITCGADPISQRPMIQHDVSAQAKSKKSGIRTNTKKLAFSSGTEVGIEWTRVVDDDGAPIWPFNQVHPLADLNRPTIENRMRGLVEGFALFNPHATIRLDWFGNCTTYRATNPHWVKWKPHHPTSPHWYEVAHLERLIGAYITHDRATGGDRLLSDLLTEFDGLSGSAKRSFVLNDADLKRVKLSELVVGNRLDSARIARLLAAMIRHTRPVASPRLGIIGEDHFRERLLALGVTPESFRYRRKTAKSKIPRFGVGAKASFIPWVLESAFGWLGEDAEDDRRIYAGANWSAAIKNPFRSFGSTGEGLETHLAEMRVTRLEPVVVVLHLAHPRIEYTDRGKSALIIKESP